MKIWNGYQKGVDLGGWFSQCDYSQDTYNNFIVEDDFKTIAGWGLDHVRLPIDYNLVETEDGSAYLAEGFERIDKAINWARNNGLNVVLDLHKTAGFSFDKGEQQSGFFDKESYQERFYALWVELAKKFGKYDSVAFELLNEVTDKAYMPTWNKVAIECIKRIREVAPNTYILVGGYWNNSVSAVRDIADPVDDKIVYNFHCYDPLMFTHQGAPWIDNMDHGFRVPFTATFQELDDAAAKMGIDCHNPKEFLAKPITEEYFEALFADALKVAEERNVILYCGEYGVINRASAEDTLGWFKEINKVFVKYGIGRAAWSFRRMDFGLTDDHMKPVLDEIIKYL